MEPFSKALPVVPLLYCLSDLESSRRGRPALLLVCSLASHCWKSRQLAYQNTPNRVYRLTPAGRALDNEK